VATVESTPLNPESRVRAVRQPNFLLFDEHGGFCYTDHGVGLEGCSYRTGFHSAKADGSWCGVVVFPLDAPNGIGLSPAGDRLYAAETHAGRVWTWPVTGPGAVDVANPAGAGGGTLLHGAPDHQLFDSLAVDGEGWVCVGTLLNGGVTAISPDGSAVEHHALADVLVTNICFAGDEPRAYCTLSGTGLLVEIAWPRPGLRLAYSA
jgi:gluconolactonase